MSELSQRKCEPCEGGVSPMGEEEARKHLSMINDDWKMDSDGKRISRDFKFRDYYHTTAFINAVAWIAHCEDHHPDISFGYNQATVVYSTHNIGGLSENDFICAAKVDALQ